MWRDVHFERCSREMISDLGSSVNSLTPERCREVAGNHHSAHHVHEGPIDVLVDSVRGAGVRGCLFMGYAEFFEECNDGFYRFSEVLATLVGPEVNQSSTRLVLDQWEPLSEDL